MQHISQIIIQNLSYKTPDDKSIFEDLTLTFGIGKTAIVGKNGSGKTTLVKLIAGELSPNSGSIKLNGTAAICPQNLNAFAHSTIADVFDATAKLYALDKIKAGDALENDFTILNDDWNIQERIQKQLKAFDLEKLDLRRRLDSLSGGEITKLWLAKTFATNADFLILDEPTNNLDITARKLLYGKITNCKKNLVIISHDRKLLELMQQIIEITVAGIKIYGGNYSDYLQQKNTQQTATERQLADAKKLLQKTKLSIQAAREKRAERESQGMRLRKSGSQAPIILDGMQQRATKNQGALATREEHMLDKAQKSLNEAKVNIEISEEFKFSLPETKVPNGKIVVCLEQVDFSYPNSNKQIVNNFNLTITGPERIAITGANGSGKTTLVKLITGGLTQANGKITRGIENIRYLDQHASLLDQTLSVLDNFRAFNPQIKETEACFCLARFLFRNRDALKIVMNLSNGEKTRAMLACILMAKQPPQLLILDEPTNHMDIASITAIESALNCYEGAMIVISHDEIFIENIAITKTIPF
ncbi:MAG: ABC-F family ATP-binding cassette domain-containing protein [bacterium]